MHIPIAGKLVLLAALGAALLLQSDPAQARQKRKACVFLGGQTTRATAKAVQIKWVSVWNRTKGHRWRINGASTRDKHGSFVLSGSCSNKRCSFHKRYTTGKLRLARFLYKGRIRDTGVDDGTEYRIKGTWGRFPRKMNLGPWQATVRCGRLK